MTGPRSLPPGATAGWGLLGSIVLAASLTAVTVGLVTTWLIKKAMEARR